MNQVSNELFFGYISHYAIGIALALPYVFGWHLFIGGPVSVIWTIAYGILTTVASWFLVYPSMGLGVCGRLSPEGIKASLSSLANHLFYGVGMTIGIALV